MKFLGLLFLSLFAFSGYSQDTQDQSFVESLKVKPYLRVRETNDSVSRKNSLEFDSSGIVIEKTVTPNLSVLFNPEFQRQSAIQGVSTGTSNDYLGFFVNEAYFTINDLTRTSGDLGIKLTAGVYANPNYKMETYYQPFRFIYKPLEDKILANGKRDLGVMVSKNFFDDAVKTNIAYVTGVSSNGEFSVNPNNDNINAGAVRLDVTVFPFKNVNAALKDLSLGLNWKAVLMSISRSWYSLLLGYKYDKLSTSLEYLKSYSTNAATYISGASFFASYEICSMFQPIVRWDYTDTSATTGKRTPDHLVVMGANTKWFDGKLQAALTYDQEYIPSTKATIAKRIMLSTQYSY
ncbi:MAG: hypothetical protein NTY22_00160 [Proteobacteria bacterium]|nr:hypothetical protein [Pseudomonadota bacterium]